MRSLRFLILILSLSLLLCGCEIDIPVMAGTQTDTNETEPQDTPPPETEPPREVIGRVAITYDDGPAFDNDAVQRLTYKLVDEFAKYGGKATFFVVGNRINHETGKAMQYADAHGFEYAIHAYTHDIYFDECSEQDYLDELRLTKEAIEKYIGKSPTLLRAPGGAITAARALLGGYPVIHWSVDSEDWRHKSRADEQTAKANIDAIVEKVLRNVEDGDIILMHEIYENTYEATKIILERLYDMGFEFVTVTELIGEENLEVGKTYYSAH